MSKQEYDRFRNDLRRELDLKKDVMKVESVPQLIALAKARGYHFTQNDMRCL